MENEEGEKNIEWKRIKKKWERSKDDKKEIMLMY